MSTIYDPLVPPDPKVWLADDEWDRMDSVLEHHTRAGVDLPNERLHATIHVTVENQAALGDETPVAGTIVRLIEEGLDRHDAVHAVGAVLAGHIWQLMSDESGEATDPNVAYFDEVRNLTAQKWLDEYSEPKE